MILAIAWKNIWRNKVRSAIIMSAIWMGIFGGLFMIAFVIGMSNQRLAAALKTETSHIQVHHPEYKKNDEFRHLLNNSPAIMKAIGTMNSSAVSSRRILINAMISSAEAGASVKLIGVDPEQEEKVTDLFKQIVEGHYFEGSKSNPVILGEKLANKLNVRIRSKVVIQFQDNLGYIQTGAFRVSGIYKTKNSAYDEFNAFAYNRDLERITSLRSSQAHEIAIYLYDGSTPEPLKKALAARFPETLVETWRESNPILGYMDTAMDQYMYFFIAFILLALFFGIVNTMLMAILERSRELGMLRAIGMKSRQVFVMIMTETIMLTVTGAVAGVMWSLVVIRYFGTVGIDLSIWGEGLKTFGYNPIIYPEISDGFLYTVAVLVVITGILASIYPAIKALKLKPVEALRIE